MTGLLIGCVVCGTPAQALYTPAQRVKDAAAQFEALAGPHAPWRKADGPAVQQSRARLDALLRNQAKVIARVQTGTYAAVDLFNVLQVERDLVDAGDGLSGSAGGRLAWQVAGLRMAAALHALAVERVRAGATPPQATDQTEAQLQLYRQRVATAGAEYMSSVVRPGR